MTVLEVIQRSTDFLSRKGVESPRLQVELLLAHVLQMPRMKLYLNFDRTLSEPELETLRSLIKRRAEREPLQHIVGSTSFCGFEFTVNRDVLVPRPETELLAEQAWGFLSTPAGSAATVLDFGTGSGCLAIVIALKSPTATVQAVDISEPALAVARANALRHGVGERVHFHAGDGFKVVDPGIAFDLIVSNPPYLPELDLENLEPEVKLEPASALFSGHDGLDLARALVRIARERLGPSGWLLLELDPRNAPTLRQELEDDGWRARLEADLSGRERFIVARPKPRA